MTIDQYTTLNDLHSYIDLLYEWRTVQNAVIRVDRPTLDRINDIIPGIKRGYYRGVIFKLKEDERKEMQYRDMPVAKGGNSPGHYIYSDFEKGGAHRVAGSGSDVLPPDRPAGYNTHALRGFIKIAARF